MVASGKYGVGRHALDLGAPLTSFSPVFLRQHWIVMVSGIVVPRGSLLVLSGAEWREEHVAGASSSPQATSGTEGSLRGTVAVASSKGWW